MREDQPWEETGLTTLQGDPIAWYPASNDGNLEEGFVVLHPEKDGTTSATLCFHYEPNGDSVFSGVDAAVLAQLRSKAEEYFRRTHQEPPGSADPSR